MTQPHSDPLSAIRANLAALEARSVLRRDREHTAPASSVEIDELPDRALSASSLADDAALADAAAARSRGTVRDQGRFRPRRAGTRHDVEAITTRLEDEQPATLSPSVSTVSAVELEATVSEAGDPATPETPAVAEQQGAPSPLPAAAASSPAGVVAPPPAVTVPEMPAPRAAAAGGGRAVALQAPARSRGRPIPYAIVAAAVDVLPGFIAGTYLGANDDDTAGADRGEVLPFPTAPARASTSRATGYGHQVVRGYG